MSGAGLHAAGVVGVGVLDEDHEAFRAGVRAFLLGEVAPSYGEWTAAGAVPAAVYARAAGQGLAGVAIGEQYSGGGVDDPRFEAVVVSECLRLGLTGFAVVLSRHAEAARWLARHGTPEQRDRWLPGLAEGSVRATVALGSVDADGGLALGDVAGAAAASVLVVDLGRARSGADRGVAVVDLAAPGVTRVAVGSLGAAGVEAADIEVAAPDSAVGGAAALRLACFRAAAVLGAAGARSALEQTLAYVNDRHVFATPVAAFGNSRRELTAVAADLAGSEALLGRLLDAELAGTATTGDAALAGLRAVAVHDAAVDLGLQLHGGYGYMLEYPIARAFADARYLRLVSGRDAMVDEAARAVGLVPALA